MALSCLGALATLPVATHRAGASRPAEDKRPADDVRPFDTAAPTRLGAASNFSQGANPALLDAAAALGVRRFRDSLRWPQAERSPGVYRFDRPTSTYPAAIERDGGRLTLTLNWGNPLYDQGKTPHSPEALAAFGQFAAEAVSRYPAIDTVEIGNEVNGGNFVSGPVKEAGLAQRPAYHLAMVAAARAAVARVRPDVQVIGGATHSLPGGFLRRLVESDRTGALQGLAVHPYTTPIDQLPAQIAFLQGNPRIHALPFYVTEFGSQNPARAADDLVRGYVTLSALGIAEFDWYPLNERGDGMVPLLTRDLSLTGAGRAFRFLSSRVAGVRAHRLPSDAFTFLYSLGPNTLVLWGSPRAVKLAGSHVTAYSAEGETLIGQDLALSPDRALILIGDGIGRAGPSAFALGCQSLIADSFYQFGYPTGGEPRASGDPFSRIAVMPDGSEVPFTVFAGQQRRGVPWTPYLGLMQLPRLRLLADSMRPDGAAIVHRFVAPRAMRLRVQAQFSAVAPTATAFIATLEGAATKKTESTRSGPVDIEALVTLRAGQPVTIAVKADEPPQPSENRPQNARPDRSALDYRIRLSNADACSSS